MRHKLLPATLFAATMVPGGQADEPAPEKQVAALSEQHRLAAIKGDTKVLDAVLDDDWVVVGPTGEVETKRQQEKQIKDKSLVFEAIDPKEVKVRVHGDAAIVMGLYHIKTTLNGRTVDGVFRNTEVFTKQAGTWRCVFNQVTPVAVPLAESMTGYSDEADRGSDCAESARETGLNGPGVPPGGKREPYPDHSVAGWVRSCFRCRCLSASCGTRRRNSVSGI